MVEKFCKVLIVDDEFIIRQGIEYMINWESEGFKIVAQALNGEDALTKIEETQPHIVLTDIVMPKMDGMALTKVIQEKYPNIRVIVLSSYSEFDYVRNTFQYGAVDYILKPTLSPESILTALRKAASLLEGVTLHNEQYDHILVPLTQYILGYVDELNHKDMDAYFHYQNYVLFATNLNFYHHKKESREFFSNLQQFEHTTCCAMMINEEIILNVYAYDEAYYDEFIQKLKWEVKEKALCIVSEPFHRIEDIKERYLTHIAPSITSRFYMKDKSFMFLKDIPHMTTLDRFDNRSFTSLLSSAHLSEAMNVFYDFVIASLQKRVNEIEIKSFAGNKLYNFISVLEEQGFNEKNIRYFKLECLSKLESAIYVEDFQKEMKQIYDDFYFIIQNYELESNQAMINRIMKYIYDHYDEPLTLNDVAQTFNFSYQYLSSYFSNRNEKTFIEYLNEIRIDKAAKYLKEEDMAISDIGINVGYSDHSYFCKVFKKYKGMTPSEYRKH